MPSPEPQPRVWPVDSSCCIRQPRGRAPRTIGRRPGRARSTLPSWRCDGATRCAPLWLGRKERLDVDRHGFQCVELALHFWTDDAVTLEHGLCFRLVAFGFDGQQVVRQAPNAILNARKIDRELAGL